MKYFAIFVALVMAFASFNTCSAVSEPVCSIPLANGELLFIQRNQAKTYTDDMGRCMVAICGPDFKPISIPCQ